MHKRSNFGVVTRVTTVAMQEKFHALTDELHGVARFRLPATITAWAICVLGWTTVALLPDVYESTARVFADTRTALSPVIQGLLSAGRHGATESGTAVAAWRGAAGAGHRGNGAARTLYAGQRAKVMENLREHIEISVYPSSERDTDGSVYWLSYRDADRERSLKVVEILLNNFMHNTVGGKMANSEAAQQFLQSRSTRPSSGCGKRRSDLPRSRSAMWARCRARKATISRGCRTRWTPPGRRARRCRSPFRGGTSCREQLQDGALLAASSGAAHAGKSRTPHRADTLTQLAEAQAKARRLVATVHRATSGRGSAAGERSRNLKAQHERELAALRRGDSEHAHCRAG